MSNKPEVHFPEVRYTPGIVLTRDRAIALFVGGWTALYITGSLLFGYLEVAIGADPIRDQRAEQSTHEVTP